MGKGIVNIIGGSVVALVLILAVAFGVSPQLTSAAATSAQADQVAATNATYQAQLVRLRIGENNLAAIQASVASLHMQIPAAPKLDQAFELISHAATSAGATVENIKADDPAAFKEATTPVPAGQPAPTATPSPTPSPSAAGAASASSGATTGTSGDGRTQIPLSIQVTVPDADAAAKFLDGLRAGPRLLSNVKSTATPQTAGIDLTVDAMAFADQTGVDK